MLQGVKQNETISFQCTISNYQLHTVYIHQSNKLLWPLSIWHC